MKKEKNKKKESIGVEFTMHLFDRRLYLNPHSVVAWLFDNGQPELARQLSQMAERSRKNLENRFDEENKEKKEPEPEEPMEEIKKKKWFSFLN
jgi:hypothetical protein